MLICYVVLVAAGVTTSSLGIAILSDDASTGAHGLLLGGPDPIRSDEFLRTTPWRIGIATSGEDDFVTPLSNPDPAIVTTGLGGVATTVVFPEARVLAVVGAALPEQAFAAVWWLPVLLVLLLLPRWFRQLGARPAVGLPATLLVVLAPVSIWWSWSVLGVLCWALLAAVLATSAVRRERAGRARLVTVLLVVAAGVSLTRLGLSYLPWAVPLGAGVLLPTAAHLASRAGRRRRALLLSGGAVLTAALALAAYLFEHRASLRVLAGTTYPGSRRFTGEVRDLSQLFGAPHLWVLQQNPPLPATTNQSEIASGYLVLALAAVVMVPAVRWRAAGVLRVPALAAGATLCLLASWGAIAWPAAGARLPVINLVSPVRLVQVLGIVGTLVFALTCAAWERAGPDRRGASAAMAALVTFFVTASTGGAFRQQYLPSMRAVWVALAALLVSAGVAAAVHYAGRAWALVPLALLAVPVVALVDPWQQGFGDLTDGRTAHVVDSLGTPDARDSFWGTDDLGSDALLMANARPSLSGQQWAGPNVSAWKVLDPAGRYREEWNRGASYVVFAWAPSGTPLDVTTPGPDLVRIGADPCDAKLARLGLRHLMSTRPLTGGCLSEQATLVFAGTQRWVYNVSPA